MRDYKVTLGACGARSANGKSIDTRRGRHQVSSRIYTTDPTPISTPPPFLLLCFTFLSASFVIMKLI